MQSSSKMTLTHFRLIVNTWASAHVIHQIKFHYILYTPPPPPGPPPPPPHTLFFLNQPQDKVQINCYRNYGLCWRERCRSFHYEAYTGDENTLHRCLMFRRKQCFKACCFVEHHSYIWYEYSHYISIITPNEHGSFLGFGNILTWNIHVFQLHVIQLLNAPHH